MRAHASCVTLVRLLPGSDPQFMLIVLGGSIFYSHFAGRCPSRPGLGRLAVSSVHSRCMSSPISVLSGAEFPSGVWLPPPCAPGLLQSPVTLSLRATSPLPWQLLLISPKRTSSYFLNPSTGHMELSGCKIPTFPLPNQ